jgi:hypothetical protein
MLDPGQLEAWVVLRAIDSDLFKFQFVDRYMGSMVWPGPRRFCFFVCIFRVGSADKALNIRPQETGRVDDARAAQGKAVKVQVFRDSHGNVQVLR